MLEILIVISLSRKIAAKARDKGRSGPLFVFMLVALWLGGEIFGAVAGCIVSMVALGEDEPNLGLCYGGALAGAIFGALVAFLAVKAVAPAHAPEEDDYERYDRRDAERY